VTATQKQNMPNTNHNQTPTGYTDSTPSPVNKHVLEQRLYIQDSHPMFTGKCPDCQTLMTKTEPPRIHWDCECGWIDDSI